MSNLCSLSFPPQGAKRERVWVWGCVKHLKFRKDMVAFTRKEFLLRFLTSMIFWLNVCRNIKSTLKKWQIYFQSSCATIQPSKPLFPTKWQSSVFPYTKETRSRKNLEQKFLFRLRTLKPWTNLFICSYQHFSLNLFETKFFCMEIFLSHLERIVTGKFQKTSLLTVMCRYKTKNKTKKQTNKQNCDTIANYS